MDQLAIIGGKKAFDRKFQDSWLRPKEREKQLIGELIDRNELSGSGFGVSKKFEETFRDYIGCKYSLAFSHGSAALMSAYYASGVGPGDEVITPAVGYLLSYSGAMHMGARPIFCDIDPKTLLIDPDQIRQKITSRTKAIEITHMNGRICNLDEILDISENHGIPIIDDACHALGGEWGGRKIGNFDHITCFSLQGTPPKGKPVGAGEGGFACTNSKSLYQKMLAYCHLHRKNIKAELAGSPYEALDEEVLGLKWRPHPLALAAGIISMESLDYRNARRSENYRLTLECLSEFDFIAAPAILEKAKMGGFIDGLKFIYDPSRLNGVPFNALVKCLQSEGVPIVGPLIGPLEYRRYIFTSSFDLWGRGRGPIDGPWSGLGAYQAPNPKEFPVSEKMSQTVFTLPSFIEVDPDYYTGLKRAFQKMRENQNLLLSVIF